VTKTGQATYLELSAYEHFFLNEEHPEYPICPILYLCFQQALDPKRLRGAVRKAQARHPLLRALINGSGSQPRKSLRWVIPSQSPEPWLHVAKDGEGEAYPADARQIDLRHEAGLRLFLKSPNELLLQFHHAATDGIGMLQFVRDLFFAYHEQDHILGPANLAKLNEGRLFNRVLPGGWGLLQDLRQILGLIRFKPEGIEGRRRPGSSMMPQSQSGLYDCFCVSQLPEADFVPIRAFCKKHQLTLNDLLLYSLEQTVRHWNQKPLQRVRISMPMNLRGPADYDSPACNMTGLYFYERGEQIEPRLAALGEVHREMMKVKTGGLVSAFNRLSLLMGRFRYGLRWMVGEFDPKRCQTSTCLSNLGRIDQFLPREIFAKNQLEIVGGCAPIRPGTTATFCVASYHGQMSISTLCDPLFFDAQTANELLHLFIAQIRDIVREV